MFTLSHCVISDLWTKWLKGYKGNKNDAIVNFSKLYGLHVLTVLLM
jgi:hypothetical protein